mgnify:CR=1 FL=1
MDRAIVWDSVKKSYASPHRITIFSDASIEVLKGEFVGIFGPSGVGKTTMILLTAGILNPDRGKIYVLGRDITEMSRDELALFRRKHIGIVFQFFNLIPMLTVLENVLLPLELNGFSRNEAIRRAKEILSYVGLLRKADMMPSRLSGGEQQRIAIARAVVHNPQIVLADEPTGNLDEENKESIFELFRDLNKEGITIIVATHDVELARRYVHRGYHIRGHKFNPVGV